MPPHLTPTAAPKRTPDADTAPQLSVPLPVSHSDTASPSAASAGISLPDAQLVQHVLAGHVDAFAVLVDRHHAHCLRVASNLLGNADDVVQEAFVRAYRHLGRYSERDRFAAWLLRIVVNQCRSRATRDARYTALDPQLHEQWAVDESHAAAAQRADRREELAIALAQLAPEQREAIVLRFGEELSYDEMATITGAGVSALKMRVQRACARLRTLLSELQP